MFKILATNTFMNECNKMLDGIEMRKFRRFKEKLKVNPFLGKPLRVYYVREFKFSKGKRAYFIVYEEFNLVLFVSCSNKKNQQKKIDEIFLRLREYYNYVKDYNS